MRRGKNLGHFRIGVVQIAEHTHTCRARGHARRHLGAIERAHGAETAFVDRARALVNHTRLVRARSHAVFAADAATVIDREVFSHAALRRLYALVEEFDNLHMVVYDRTNSYLLDDPACFDAEFDKDLPNPVVLRDLPSPDTSIVKVSISCDSAQMDMAYILSRELEADFVFAPSGAKWIDVMQRGVNKATGINQVLAAHGVAAENVMAFGDSMNDYEILRMVGHSCAMGNGRWAVKQISKRIIGKNTEQAVQAELRAVVESRAIGHHAFDTE